MIGVAATSENKYKYPQEVDGLGQGVCGCREMSIVFYESLSCWMDGGSLFHLNNYQFLWIQTHQSIHSRDETMNEWMTRPGSSLMNALMNKGVVSFLTLTGLYEGLISAIANSLTIS